MIKFIILSVVIAFVLISCSSSSPISIPEDNISVEGDVFSKDIDILSPINSNQDTIYYCFSDAARADSAWIVSCEVGRVINKVELTGNCDQNERNIVLKTSYFAPVYYGRYAEIPDAVGRFKIRGYRLITTLL